MIHWLPPGSKLYQDIFSKSGYFFKIRIYLHNQDLLSKSGYIYFQNQDIYSKSGYIYFQNQDIFSKLEYIFESRIYFQNQEILKNLYIYKSRISARKKSYLEKFIWWFMSNQLAYFWFIFKCCWTNIRFHPLVRILKIAKLFIPNICFSSTVPNWP